MAATKQACREALALFGVPPGEGSPVFSKYLSPQQRRQCLRRLLRTAAGLGGGAWPNRSPAPGAHLVPAEEALRLLDRAARLNLPPTRAYHLRRPRYLELLGQPTPPRRETAARGGRPTRRRPSIISCPAIRTRSRAELAEAARRFRAGAAGAAGPFLGPVFPGGVQPPAAAAGPGPGQLDRLHDGPQRISCGCICCAASRTASSTTSRPPRRITSRRWPCSRTGKPSTASG